MHDSVQAWLATHVDKVRGKRVLEVGSYDENGSARLHLQHEAASWVGVDMRPGPGVDLALGGVDITVESEYAAAMARFREDFAPFEVVVCTEMLEHAKPWRLALQTMIRMLGVGGWLLLTTRSPGMPRHDHPADYWRFTPLMMWQLFVDFSPLSVKPDPEFPGVFVAARKRRYWNLGDVQPEAAPTELVT